MKSEEIKSLDKKYIANTYGRFDVVIEEGKSATCYNPEGKKFIDFTSGIGVNSLGFSNKNWVEAIEKQLHKMQHTSNLFYTEPMAKLAMHLVERTGMDKVFFTNSGAEANECAIKTVRKYGNMKSNGKKNEIISLVNSFHGRTMATITATGQKHYHKDFKPFVNGFDYCNANDIDAMKQSVNENTCAIMIEIVQGEGGVISVDKDYVVEVNKLCKEKDLLLIVDEVQTGVGRTGKLFAYEHYGIKPDLITFAKGIGGGLPIGGVIFNDKTSGVLVPGDHGTTYGGNPIACAGALEVLKQLDDEFLLEVEKKSVFLRNKIKSSNCVLETTGLGLMVGISLKDKDTSKIVSECIKQGLLVLTAKDKIRLLPPLNITMEELEEGINILLDVIDK